MDTKWNVRFVADNMIMPFHQKKLSPEERQRMIDSTFIP